MLDPLHAAVPCAWQRWRNRNGACCLENGVSHHETARTLRFRPSLLRAIRCAARRTASITIEVTLSATPTRSLFVARHTARQLKSFASQRQASRKRDAFAPLHLAFSPRHAPARREAPTGAIDLENKECLPCNV